MLTIPSNPRRAHGLVVISSGFLSTVSTNGGTLLVGTVSYLVANTPYSITIFAAAETFGYSFIVTTAPLRKTSYSPLFYEFYIKIFPPPPASMCVAVAWLTGKRYDNQSIELDWPISSGTTVYGLTVADMNGTVLDTTTFDVTSTFIVNGLVNGVDYQFTLYSGNSYDIDYSEGVSTTASTYTLLCTEVTEANAIWPTTSSFMVAGCATRPLFWRIPK